MISLQISDDEPPGYGLHSPLNGDERAAILLPRDLLEQLGIECLKADRVRREEVKRSIAVAEEQRIARMSDQARAGGSQIPPPQPTKPLSPLEAARALTVPGYVPQPSSDTVAVFDWGAAQKRFHALKNSPMTADKDLLARDLRHFAKAMAHGPWRSVARPEGWRDALASLAAEMPNFAAVVEAVQRAMALADFTGQPLMLQPILLLGEPGVGKTHFTQRLAEVLQTPIHRQAFDNVQTNSGLRGSDRHWGNTAVGALWELIVLGKHANPVVLLDELDKGERGGNNYRPVDALLSLLEPVTATKVKDLSIDFEFDASRVLYVATANDADRISAPVRSRFLEFFIEEPDIDGRLVLARAIFQATLERMVPQEDLRAKLTRPTDLQIVRLAWMTPRQIRMASERALGALVYAGRDHFLDSDFDVVKAQKSREKKSGRSRDRGGDGGRDGDEPSPAGDGGR